MALTITIELNNLEEKCIRYFAASPEEWVNNLVQSRIFSSKEEIYAAEVKRMTADPNIENIPANKDKVVEAADIVYASDISNILPPATV
jgi:hypothetical protein